jgi:hypothetical protein
VIGVLVIRITGEGYILVDETQREYVLEELNERWDLIFEEARWGSIDHAMELYAEMFTWIDQQGKKVRYFPQNAEFVLPPRNLELDELQSLLGHYKR